ncbi:TM1802 family CRISPR-associated protein [Chitinophaga defluvii]|uniref:TM1802 family CRISPR-associated protein n=1 Tax=Chitinophaga defluvii TaxID=3163343 RepID=A0ABV2T1N0_9BACT
MILTLSRLGEHLSYDQDEWSDIIDTPKIDPDKDNLVVTLVFNIDEQSISVAVAQKYDQQSPRRYRNVSIKGGNNKASYVCCETNKVAQIEKTLFGKVDNKGKEPVKGEFLEYITTKFPSLSTTLLGQVLTPLFNFREMFLEAQWNLPETIYSNLLGEDYKKSSPHTKLILVYAAVVAKDLGIAVPTPLYELDGFDEFIRLDRFTKPVSETKKLSYATGMLKENVISVAFPNRYSLNYMFVETTLNYAAGFNKNNFHQNYQLNSEEQLYLERASDYLLKHQQISIAGIPHCIIPQFPSYKPANFTNVLESCYKKSELLFQPKNFEYSLAAFEDQIDEGEIYWLNFLAFESDGNSFKTINLIKDVSKTHFEKVLSTLKKVDRFFDTLDFAVNWEDVMSDYQNKEKKRVPFNLYTIYQLIPQRKDKEKKNEALVLFKSILEQRKIAPQILFEHFTELILCHYYNRYEAYKNVKRFGENVFDLAVRDAVFKYLSIFTTLSHLKLLNQMETTNQQELDDIEEIVDTTSLEETTTLTEYQQRIESFFERMNYVDYQKALFYLGRMLSTVTSIQREKKRTVLDKLNFNGMKRNDIVRLREALIEKSKQYKGLNKLIFNDGKFLSFFDYNNWNINPKEALFFILNGYSFGTTIKKSQN